MQSSWLGASGGMLWLGRKEGGQTRHLAGVKRTANCQVLVWGAEKTEEARAPCSNLGYAKPWEKQSRGWRQLPGRWGEGNRLRWQPGDAEGPCQAPGERGRSRTASAPSHSIELLWMLFSKRGPETVSWRRQREWKSWRGLGLVIFSYLNCKS